MHNSVRVRVVERLKYLVNVESDVHVVEATHQLLCLDIGDVFKNEARSLRALLTHHVVHFNDVGASVQVLENFRLPIDLFRADGLENLNNAFLVVCLVAPLVHFRIFAASEFLHDFILRKVAPFDVILGVVRVILRSLGTNIFVWAIEA